MHVPFFNISLSAQLVYTFPVLSNVIKSMLQLSTGRKKLCMVLSC